VRADVQDNAYAFVIAPPRRPEQRYVVWTGGDGTPHVQPAVAPALPVRARCARPPREVAQVTPNLAGACLPFAPIPRPLPRPARRPSPRRPPVPVLVPVPCALALPEPVALLPATPLPRPRPPRHR
jgi:hypothetical protein